MKESAKPASAEGAKRRIPHRWTVGEKTCVKLCVVWNMTCTNPPCLR